jgi:chromate reductase
MTEIPFKDGVEAYIQFEKGLITEDGSLTDPKVDEFLRKYMTEFSAFIGRVLSVLPRNT